MEGENCQVCGATTNRGMDHCPNCHTPKQSHVSAWLVAGMTGLAILTLLLLFQ